MTERRMTKILSAANVINVIVIACTAFNVYAFVIKKKASESVTPAVFAGETNKPWSANGVDTPYISCPGIQWDNCTFGFGDKVLAVSDGDKLELKSDANEAINIFWKAWRKEMVRSQKEARDEYERTRKK